mmetsp:Transcript_56583/g.115842  ORF Transcript_56583/g.115842 Transcript_56583/m.115842 type:complete len:219 (-) Transcript_56583:86-742(-)
MHRLSLVLHLRLRQLEILLHIRPCRLRRQPVLGGSLLEGLCGSGRLAGHARAGSQLLLLCEIGGKIRISFGSRIAMLGLWLNNRVLCRRELLLLLLLLREILLHVGACLGICVLEERAALLLILLAEQRGYRRLAVRVSVHVAIGVLYVNRGVLEQPVVNHLILAVLPHTMLRILSHGTVVKQLLRTHRLVHGAVLKLGRRRRARAHLVVDSGLRHRD